MSVKTVVTFSFGMDYQCGEKGRYPLIFGTQHYTKMKVELQSGVNPKMVYTVLKYTAQNATKKKSLTTIQKQMSILNILNTLDLYLA